MRSGGTTAEGPGDVTRVGPGGAYAACTGGGAAKRGLGGVDAAHMGGGPATRGLGVVAVMCTAHAYGGAITG